MTAAQHKLQKNFLLTEALYSSSTTKQAAEQCHAAYSNTNMKQAQEGCIALCSNSSTEQVGDKKRTLYSNSNSKELPRNLCLSPAYQHLQQKQQQQPRCRGILQDCSQKAIPHPLPCLYCKSNSNKAAEQHIDPDLQSQYGLLTNISHRSILAKQQH